LKALAPQIKKDPALGGVQEDWKELTSEERQQGVVLRPSIG